MLRLFRPFAAVSVLASAAVASGACGLSPDDPWAARAPGGHVTRAPNDAGARLDSSAPADDAGDEAGCARGTLPLVIESGAGVRLGPAPYKLYVPATSETRPVLFLLDTGSPITFLHEPLTDGGPAAAAADDYVADAGSAVVGCDLLSLFGAAVAADPPVGGRPVAGTLGGDRLLARPLQLDFARGQAVWNDPGVPFAGAAAWPSAPFDRLGGYVHVHGVAFDGVPVHMFVDTGSPDSVWVGQQGQPGDVEIDGRDSLGEIIRMYLGTATLTIGDYEEKVPVMRVPSFPYLQQAASALDVKLDGLFGLSSFARGIVFDTDASVVRVAP